MGPLKIAKMSSSESRAGYCGGKQVQHVQMSQQCQLSGRSANRVAILTLWRVQRAARVVEFSRRATTVPFASCGRTSAASTTASSAICAEWARAWAWIPSTACTVTPASASRALRMSAGTSPPVLSAQSTSSTPARSTGCDSRLPLAALFPLNFFFSHRL